MSEEDYRNIFQMMGQKVGDGLPTWGCLGLGGFLLFVFALWFFAIGGGSSVSTEDAHQLFPTFAEDCDDNVANYTVGTDGTISVTSTIDRASWEEPIDNTLVQADILDAFSQHRFAGGYALVYTNTGVSVVDVRTGQIVAYNLQTMGGITAHGSSRLLMINDPASQEAKSPDRYNLSDESSRDYYVIEELRDGSARLRLLCIGLPKKQLPVGACRDLPLVMVSPATHERKKIFNTCDFPSQNWMAAVGPALTSPMYWEFVQ